MAIKRHDEELLDQLYQQYGERFGGRRDNYFSLLYLSRRFKCDPEEIAHQVALTDSPIGIDGYYLDRATRNLYLYQFKWTQDHNAFKPALDRLAREGIDRTFATSYQGSDRSDLLRYLRADLREYRHLIERVYLRFVFKGDVEAADNSAGLLERREAIEDKKYLIDRYFGDRPVELVIEFVSDRPGRDLPPPRDTFTIPFEGQVALQTGDGQAAMHLGFISLMDLFCMYDSLGEKFFDRNIRSGLNPDNAPNRKLRQALDEIVLKRRRAPEVFAFNHNGITLAVAELSLADGTATLRVPRLLNGAQTCVSLARFLEGHEGDEKFAESRSRLDAIRVLAKIIVTQDREFITQVTISNNQQNPVEAWNLRANDRLQCDLQDKFKEELGIYYSRQENAFENLSDAELEAMGIEQPRDISLRGLAQALLAAQGEIDRMSRLSEVFESARMYGETFRESYVQADARKMLIAYKIGQMLDGPMARLAERAPSRIQQALPRARNLVWALLIQSVLNDPNLPSLLQRFGTGLAQESEFREYLKEMAGRQVLSILKGVLADEGYNARMSGSKYGFLRSREIFSRSMQAAGREFGWAKRGI